MIEIGMAQAKINIGTSPDGGKVIMAEDIQSGIRMILPLTAEGAKAIADALYGSVIPVRVMPKVVGN